MNIELSKRFKKEFKKLNKKYRLTNDFAELVKSLKADPNQGVPLGRGAFKIRMSWRKE